MWGLDPETHSLLPVGQELGSGAELVENEFILGLFIEIIMFIEVKIVWYACESGVK